MISVVPVTYVGLCLSVTLLVIDLWQYYLCCIRSGANLCTICMVLYQCRMCQCVLHTVLWLLIGMLMRLLAAKPRSTQDFYSPSSQCLCGTILPTLYSMECDWRISRAEPMLFCWPMLLESFLSTISFLSLYSIYRLVLWSWGHLTHLQARSCRRHCSM